MNASLVALLLLIGILLVGFIHLGIGWYRLDARHRLVVEFTKKFINLSNTYFEKGELSNATYEWLLANVDEVNGMLGAVGTVTYKPAFANYMHNNYQILINTIPQFKSRSGVEPDDASFIEALLKRFSSVLSKTIKDQKMDLKNPIKWFSEGVASLLSIPLAVLRSFGLLSNNTYGKATSSGLFKGITAIVAIVSFIDTILTMFTGSSFTVHLLENIVSKF